MTPEYTLIDCLLGSYLGIDVAIKEVLPSGEYDVAKYFEREWRLMKYVVRMGPCVCDANITSMNDVESAVTPTLCYILVFRGLRIQMGECLLFQNS